MSHRANRSQTCELQCLLGSIQQNYPALEGKTLVTRDDIQQAREIADALLVHWGSKDYATDSDAELNLERSKLIYLLRADYREVSWAVMYVRRHIGDGERIMPSLRKIQMQYSSAPNSAEVTVSDTSSEEPQQAAQDIADATTANGQSSAPKPNATKRSMPPPSKP